MDLFYEIRIRRMQIFRGFITSLTRLQSIDALHTTRPMQPAYDPSYAAYNGKMQSASIPALVRPSVM